MFRELSIAAENVFSPPLALRSGDLASIGISGSFSATVTLQRTFDQPLASARWRDVATYTQATETSYTAPEDGWIRIGVKTGGFSSASSLVCRIGTAAHQPWVSFSVLLAACRATSQFSAECTQRMRSSVAFAGGGAGAFGAVAGPP
jgi:hypothetical protein